MDVPVARSKPEAQSNRVFIAADASEERRIGNCPEGGEKPGYDMPRRDDGEPPVLSVLSEQLPLHDNLPAFRSGFPHCE